MSGHHCHAIGCEAPVSPIWLMCRFHWFQVHRRLRDAVWAAYRPGQEVSKDPSPEWLKAANEAVQWVAQREGRRPVNRIPEDEGARQIALDFDAEATCEGHCHT